MAKVFFDVVVLGDVSQILEVIVVLRGAMNVADFVVADGDGSRRIAEGNTAIGNGQSDRRQFHDVGRRTLVERKEGKIKEILE